jgi:integrative and conjugative element protein (TIGR02256 family)
MRYLRPDGGTVEFGEAASTTIERQRQLSSTAPESGGMLLGRLVIESRNVVIDEVTEPAASDHRGRFFFVRSWKHAQQRVDSAWEESDCTRNYLGEWHTHPEVDPTPSPKDLRNWRRIAEAARYEQDFLFFVIVGTEKTRIWELDKTKGILSELVKV